MSLHCSFTDTSTFHFPNYRSQLLNILQRRISACWINKLEYIPQVTYALIHINASCYLFCWSYVSTDIHACLWPYFYPQTPMLAWQLWIAAWMRPRLAMWMICARSSAQNMSQLASNPRPSPACAIGINATRLCAGSSTASPPITRTSCSSAPVRTQHAQSVGGRLLYPAAPMKAWKSPTALHRWGSATRTMCAG